MARNPVPEVAGIQTAHGGSGDGLCGAARRWTRWFLDTYGEAYRRLLAEMSNGAVGPTLE